MPKEEFIKLAKNMDGLIEKEKKETRWALLMNM
jgi:hypothetical protein